ncbi:BUD22-domain-containing protein [Dendryphion nanum]|uniref:BUD22-domain-containing protein n=1 Tax=Dendryphion nanum TaxID=256645 RepID=A0A9P9DI66_9PLEO|nr:BUD22-domain-containing protein [Dendryphion nanum]
MPKRKRSDHSPSPSATALPQDISKQRKLGSQRLRTAQKDLSAALRLAASFERQKHGRRVKTARENNDRNALDKLSKEQTILKDLNLDKCATEHLKRTIGRVKTLREAAGLPKEWNPANAEGMVKVKEDNAVLNVKARLFKVEAVRNVVDEVVDELKEIVGAKAKIQPVKEERAKGKKARVEQEEDVSGEESDEDDMDGFGGFNARIAAPSSAEEDNSDDSLSEDNRPPSIIDSEREYEIGDEESSDEDKPESGSEIAISPDAIAASGDMDSDFSDGSEMDVKPTKTPKSKTKAKSEPENVNESHFVPALTHAAYFSGSESEASDLDAELAPKKNRKGQRARQKIWEKKYGDKAKHVAKEDRNKGWDAKRGAVDSKDWRGGNGSRSGARGGGGRGPQLSGENAQPVTKKVTKRDDVGTLHPSWAAAKAAKDKKINVQPQVITMAKLSAEHFASQQTTAASASVCTHPSRIPVWKPRLADSRRAPNPSALSTQPFVSSTPQQRPRMTGTMDTLRRSMRNDRRRLWTEPRLTGGTRCQPAKAGQRLTKPVAARQVFAQMKSDRYSEKVAKKEVARPTTVKPAVGSRNARFNAKEAKKPATVNSRAASKPITKKKKEEEGRSVVAKYQPRVAGLKQTLGIHCYCLWLKKQARVVALKHNHFRSQSGSPRSRIPLLTKTGSTSERSLTPTDSAVAMGSLPSSPTKTAPEAFNDGGVSYTPPGSISGGSEEVVSYTPPKSPSIIPPGSPSDGVLGGEEMCGDNTSCTPPGSPSDVFYTPPTSPVSRPDSPTPSRDRQDPSVVFTPTPIKPHSRKTVHWDTEATEHEVEYHLVEDSPTALKSLIRDYEADKAFGGRKILEFVEDSNGDLKGTTFTKRFISRFQSVRAYVERTADDFPTVELQRCYGNEDFRIRIGQATDVKLEDLGKLLDREDMVVTYGHITFQCPWVPAVIYDENEVDHGKPRDLQFPCVIPFAEEEDNEEEVKGEAVDLLAKWIDSEDEDILDDLDQDAFDTDIASAVTGYVCLSEIYAEVEDDSRFCHALESAHRDFEHCEEF